MKVCVVGIKKAVDSSIMVNCCRKSLTTSETSKRGICGNVATPDGVMASAGEEDGREMRGNV